jgi:hypothetical protein
VNDRDAQIEAAIRDAMDQLPDGSGVALAKVVSDKVPDVTWRELAEAFRVEHNRRAAATRPYAAQVPPVLNRPAPRYAADNRPRAAPKDGRRE